MKKIVKFLSGLICASAVLLTSCGGGGGSSSGGGSEVAPGTIGKADPALLAVAKIAKTMDPTNSKVLLFYNRADGNYAKWGCWLWKKGGDGEPGYNATDGKAVVKTQDGVSVGVWDLSTLLASDPTLSSLIETKEDMGLIIRTKGWAEKDPGTDQWIPLSSGEKHFMVLSGDSAVYTVADSYDPTIVAATSLTAKTIKATLSVTYGLETEPSDNGFVLKDDTGTVCAISDVVNFENPDNRNKNNAKYLLITTLNKIDPTKTYTLSHEKFVPKDGVSVNVLGAVADAPVYEGNDLGLTLDGSKATFKTWAPIASDVKLLLYSDVANVGNFKAETIAAKACGATTEEELLGTPAETVQMVKDPANGVWSAEVADVSSYKYYKYQMVNMGITYYVADIWSKSCSANAIASQIVDINSAPEAMPSSTTDTGYGDKATYCNPFVGDGTKAVVYEMHITDWSFAVPDAPDYTMNVGKYLDVASDKVIDHLKDIGVTHVQILPVYEFQSTVENDKYAWGYDPYHYNVPESRYVTAGYTDGTQAVLELRTLIAKLHEAGIAVIMDVVYNHTAGTGSGSLYDSTVPYYFYRFTPDGEYSNGSGCGNEVATENPMVKKYIIESLKHWMLDYHFNGFRFDLMGCLAKETMAEIYDELHKIDENVMVYGEPWTGGTSAVVNGSSSAVSSSSGTGAGAFDDDLRDSVKGAEFGGFKHGQVQGVNSDKGINLGLTGKSGPNKRNETGKLALRMNYVECHDNYTLFDKLAISKWRDEKGKTGDEVTTGNLASKLTPEGLAEVIKEDTLAGAYVILAQGTAFLNGGQEFLRTKLGNHNSYNTSNTSTKTTNGIRLELIDDNPEVYKTYKGLIALRKANSSAFGANESATAETLEPFVTKYTTGDFCVIFNASEDSVDVDATGYSKAVDVTSGEPLDAVVPAKVEAKSFVILKK